MQHPAHPNPFLRPDVRPRRRGRRPLARLARMRASMQATPTGVSLELDPMSTLGAFVPWIRGCGPGGELWMRARPAGEPGLVPDEAGSLVALADRLGVDMLEIAREDEVVFTPRGGLEIVTLAALDPVCAVHVDGPIETRDADALRTALRSAASLLEADIRATSSLSVVDDRVVLLEARDPVAPIALIAENLRYYLAAVRGCEVTECPAPDPRLVERLLARSGTIEVRPAETQVFTTAIDVGIATHGEESGPADETLVYDLHGRSWYGE